MDSTKKIIPKHSNYRDQEAGICKTHNLPLENTGGVYNLQYCSLCNNENRLKYEDAERKRMDILKEDNFKKRLEFSRIPKRFIDKRLEDFITNTEQQKKVFNDAAQLAGNQEFTGAILIGNMGTGKTLLATSIGIEFLKRGKSCIYTTLFDIILDIKESWKKDSDSSEKGVIKLYSTQDLLIIDEIGVQRVTENELIYIAKIVDNRYGNLLPTILVGNVTQKEMASMIGERAMRRILEKCKVLVFSWKPNQNKSSGLV